MNIGLIQIDGKLPNLALMKIAKFHRNKGDDIKIFDLSQFDVDQWYGSKIFMGGSGYDVNKELPKEIEKLVPDYELFNTDFSIGFSSRGCVRNCGFCIVREKEGYLRDMDMNFIKHQKVILFDNNFLASENCIEKMKYFINNKIKVNFNQGLDIRYVDKEKAELLSKIKYYDHNFKKRSLYFAYDNLDYEMEFWDGIQILVDNGVKRSHIMVYILIGFDTNEDVDWYRFNQVKDAELIPYIMVYNKDKFSDSVLLKFQRYVNRKYYQFIDWNDFN